MSHEPPARVHLQRADWWRLLAITVFSIALSLVITSTVLWITGTGLWKIGLFIATLAPLTIAPLVSFFLIIGKKRIEQLKLDLEAKNEDYERALAELTARREKQSQVFSVIGHELRTPVAAMKMMQESMDLASVKPYGAEIMASTESVLSILDDLRQVINPQGPATARTALASPAQVVDGVVTSLQELCQKQGLCLTSDVDPQATGSGRFDAQALRQIVTNLCKNAALHSEGANIQVTLQKVRQDAEKAELELRVDDDGKGIPPSDRETLFEAFTRGSSQAGGSGLGLFITRELATQIKGSIICTESCQRGACFRLRFPVLEFSPQQAEPARTSDDTLLLRDKCILFAEDTPTLQLLTERLLVRAGAKVTTVANGREALEAYAAQAFDLVITDLMMPEMDGAELTRELRRQQFKGGIITLTAAVLGAKTDALLQAGADAVLSKPLSLAVLHETLNDINHKSAT